MAENLFYPAKQEIKQLSIVQGSLERRIGIADEPGIDEQIITQIKNVETIYGLCSKLPSELFQYGRPDKTNGHRFLNKFLDVDDRELLEKSIKSFLKYALDYLGMSKLGDIYSYDPKYESGGSGEVLSGLQGHGIINRITVDESFNPDISDQDYIDLGNEDVIRLVLCRKVKTVGESEIPRVSIAIELARPKHETSSSFFRQKTENARKVLDQHVDELKDHIKKYGRVQRTYVPLPKSRTGSVILGIPVGKVLQELKRRKDNQNT